MNTVTFVLVGSDYVNVAHIVAFWDKDDGEGGRTLEVETTSGFFQEAHCTAVLFKDRLRWAAS